MIMSRLITLTINIPEKDGSENNNTQIIYIIFNKSRIYRILSEYMALPYMSPMTTLT